MGYKENLQDSTIFNFISVVLGVKKAMGEEYQSEWKKLDYNFYANYYHIEDHKKAILIRWENNKKQTFFMAFRHPPFKQAFLNRIYFRLFKQIVTNDKNRYHKVLTQVIYPAFCNDLGIYADFSNVENPTEAADLVMCALYKNFFKELPVDRFITSFSLRKKMSDNSISKLESVN